MPVECRVIPSKPDLSAPFDEPLIEMAPAKTKGLGEWRASERWKRRPATAYVWPLLEPPDILVDSIRGRSSRLDQGSWSTCCTSLSPPTGDPPPVTA